MKLNKTILLLSGAFLLHCSLAYSETGEEIFKRICVACHTVGKGRLVGPDLKDSHKKYPEVWMLKWIKSSQSLVEKKDPVAVKLFEDFNQVIMPDVDLSSAEIKSVIAYIKYESGDTLSPPPTVSAQTNNTGKDSTAVTTTQNNNTTNILPSASAAATTSANAVNAAPVSDVNVAASGSIMENNGLYAIVSLVVFLLLVVIFVLFRINGRLTKELTSVYVKINNGK